MREDLVSRNNMLINAKRLDDSVRLYSRYKNVRKVRDLIITPYQLAHNIHNISKNGLAKTALLCACDLNKKWLHNYEWLRGFDHDFELDYTFAHSERPRIAVYSAIYGKYDSIMEPLYSSDYCDYYIFTDMNVSETSLWKERGINGSDVNSLDAYHKSKWCKMHPHVLFPDYEYSIWVDGNVQIVADLLPLVDRMVDDCDMGTFTNPLHDCIYTEANFCVYHNAVGLREIKQQTRSYRSAGFPKHFGMREFSIIVRRHHSEQLINLMHDWWNQVNTYTMRDQISFPYVLWKNGLDIDYVQLLGGNWRENPRFICEAHNHKHSTTK